MSRLMMITILMAAWATTSVSAAFDETNSWHWWTNDANSNIDAHGNVWNVFHVKGNYTDTTGWELLSYNSGNIWWQYDPGVNQYPQYRSPKQSLCNGWWHAPGFTIDVAKSGYYSFYGTIAHLNGWGAPKMVFAKRDAAGTITQLYSNDAVPESLDFSTVSELQNIKLEVGDRLSVYVGSLGGDWKFISLANLGFGVTFGQTNDWHWWTNASGTHVDTNGNTWNVYHVKGNYTDISAWELLTYNTTESRWQYDPGTGQLPQYRSSKQALANGWWHAPGFVFTAGKAGIYSFYGSIVPLSGWGDPKMEFAKRDTGNTITPLYSNDAVSASLDFSTVPELQNIPLQAGERLSIYIGGLGGAWKHVDLTGVGIRIYESPGKTTYYVDSVNGNDRNNGTSSSTPWASLAPVNAMRFAPGDRILFKAGTQYTGQLSPHGSGTAAFPIVIDQYGYGNKPRIDGQDNGSVVYLYNIEYWEVNNLEITNQGTVRNPWLYGVFINIENFGTAHHLQLKNLYIHDIYSSNVKSEGGYGIFWKNAGTSVQTRFDGLLIENCHLVRTDRNGIGSSGYTSRDNWYPSLNVVIRGNLLEDIGGDGIVPTGTDGCVVEYNVLRGARMRAEDYAAGIWPWSADNTIIQFNEVSGVKGTNDGQAFDSDYNCQNSLFQYNYSHDNEGGFILICNYSATTYPGNIGNIGTIIRYNISQNDGGTYSEPIIDFNGNPQNVQIYNNTIYIGKHVSAPVVNTWEWVGGVPSNVQFSNNIFYADGIGDFVLGGGGYTFSNNVYYGNFYNRPSDSGAITANPNLIAVNSGGDGIMSLTGYGLGAGSPCISSGVTISNNGGSDFLGASILSPPSRGAFQYGTPVVETANWVTYITNTTAQCGGQIVNQGSSSVTARGVCWSTSPMPTLVDNYTQNGTGTGTYNGSLSNLLPSTTYYVRAYATNSSGTRYGHQLKFTTLSAYPSPTVPRLVTSPVTNITDSSASCGGTVIEDGWSSVTSRGVCWSTTSAQPTINDNTLSGGSGAGTFALSLTGLTNTTTYYLRAYATNAQGTTYGDTIIFTTRVVLLNDGFESSFTNWSTDWSRDTSKKHSGSYSAQCDWVDNNLTSVAMAAQGFEILDVEFWFYNQGVESTDNVYLQFYNSSGYVTLVNLSALSPENSWNYYKLSISRRGTHAQYFNSSFRIRFTGGGIDFGEYFWIDDVKISGGYYNGVIPGDQSQPWIDIPGDANSDGVVDVGDLGILAANYGGTGKTWAQGDFNGDGLVDVGDLGILAANYGTNAGNANWATDYAEAFGTTVTNDTTSTDEISDETSFVCSALGLPLLAGIFLATGLVLTISKVEE